MNPAPRMPMRKFVRCGTGELMLRSTDSAFCFVRKNKSAPVKDKLQFHCRGNNAGRTKKPTAKRAYAWSHFIAATEFHQRATRGRKSNDAWLSPRRCRAWRRLLQSSGRRRNGASRDRLSAARV